MSDQEPISVLTPEYLSVESKIRPDTIAKAYSDVQTHILRTDYKKDIGNDRGSNLVRMMEWVEDPGVVSTGELKNAQGQLKNFFDTYQNFFVDLSDRMLIEKNDSEFKVQWAKFNQQLTEDFLIAYDSHDEQFQQSINVFLTLAEKLSDNNDAVFREVEALTNGARVQASLMNHFQEKGCLVLAPDPSNDAEIKQWDVNNAVDFLAITPNGRVFFIDAKSGIGLSEISRSHNAHWWLYDNELPKVIDQYQKSAEDEKYKGNIEALQKKNKEKRESLESATLYIEPIMVNMDGSLDQKVKQYLEREFI